MVGWNGEKIRENKKQTYEKIFDLYNDTNLYLISL